HLFRRDFAALTEVAPVVPDDWRGGGVLRLLPDRGAAVLAEAVQGAVQGRRIDTAPGQDGGRDDLTAERLPPDLAAGAEVEGGEVVAAVAAAVGVGGVDTTAADGGHTHQRVAQPALPDRPALGGEDFEFTALGVEDDVAFADDGRGGAVVGGLVLP